MYTGLLIDRKVVTAYLLKKSTIEISIRGVRGELTTFTVVRSKTRMRKVFEAYAQKSGICRHSLQFLWDGERIRDSDTPHSLELEDQDVIECLLEQSGC